ncbi:MAG: O-antigen polymerase [Ignavibacteria bacterium]|nr:oligosaccharide repeat unit polymerase [Ignavibacteria bacterium]
MELIILFLSILVFVIISFLWKGSDLFSPAKLFTFIWAIVLFLSQLKLSYYQFEWDSFSWFIVLLSLISFLLGNFVVYTIYFQTKIQSIADGRIHLMKAESLDENKLSLGITALFLSYIISYLVIWMIVGYIPAFTYRPNITRVGWGIFGFGLFIHLTPLILYLIIVYWIKFKIQTKRFLFAVYFIITFGSFFLLYQRFSLVIGIILSLVYIYYGTTKFNLKNFFLILIPLIALIFGLSTIRESELFVYYLYYLSNMKISIKYAVITEPYMYLVMSVENFAYAVSKLQDHTYGLYTFDFLTALSGLKHTLKEHFFISDFPHLLSPFYNTYTTFFIFYRDFGILGSFFFPFVIGFLISHFYYRMRLRPSLHTISVYGMFVIIVVFSFFIPLITWLYFVFDFVVIYMVTKMIVYNYQERLDGVFA